MKARPYQKPAACREHSCPRPRKDIGWCEKHANPRARHHTRKIPGYEETPRAHSQTDLESGQLVYADPAPAQHPGPTGPAAGVRAAPAAKTGPAARFARRVDQRRVPDGPVSTRVRVRTATHA